MYRIQVDANTGTEWKPFRKMFADGFLVQGVQDDGDDAGAHVQTWMYEICERDLPLLLCSGRILCRAVLRAFPLAVWRLLTGWMRKQEEGMAR